jgi:thiamine kinase-like enzyme
MEDEILEKIKLMCPEKIELNSSQIVLTSIFSGTNKITKIEFVDDSRPLILREFGRVAFINPKNERNNFELVSKNGLGPRSLLCTDSFRIEEFISGETLLRSRCGEFAERIVPHLISFHSLPVRRDKNFTLKYIEKWSDLMLKNFAVHNSEFLSSEEKNLIKTVTNAVENEKEQILNLISKYPEPIVFCHHDFSYGNIIQSPEKFWIIDYEYAGPGFASVDLASFIIETMFDFSKPEFQFIPDEEMPYEQQRKFSDTYAEMTGKEKDVFWKDVVKSKAVVCYLGMLWASCKYVPGDVSMLAYANTRLSLYTHYKCEFLNLYLN